MQYHVIGSPAGNYWHPRTRGHLVSIYARAGEGGHGAAKRGGNHKAASMIAQTEGEKHGCSRSSSRPAPRGDAIEELGGMNVFFSFSARKQDRYPELTGHYSGGRDLPSLILAG